MKFEPGQARAWAQSELRGVAGCLMPTFTGDLNNLNEAAIRHDASLERELGFTGALLVSECGTTPTEFRRFIDIVVDEVGDDMVTILQASEPTLADTLSLVRDAEAAGVDLVLMSYPLTFYPQSPDEVVEFTKTVADATNMGMVVFALDMWNFERLHPSGFAPAWLEEMVDTIPNVVAIKNEIGYPGISGNAQVFKQFRDRVLVADPMEMNCAAWIPTFGMPWMGTSNYEYYGPEIPRMFELLQNPETFEAGMDIYWRLHPARGVVSSVGSTAVAGANLVHRMQWKYQGWLNGFNGGPVRFPQMRIDDGQMRALRRGLVNAGLPVTGDDDAEFFVGRHPK
ncbi:dihydrodipicolinate synthase family protein [Embleya sp. NPDC020886]|uniref:dihydrodipicolinate synthase family protein n=1 Tax=Embleya sp. NPDC020886 TaxID=3363980 RepID=UPI00379CAB7E